MNGFKFQPTSPDPQDRRKRSTQESRLKNRGCCFVLNVALDGYSRSDYTIPLIVARQGFLINSSWLLHDFLRGFFLVSEVLEEDTMSLAFNRSLNPEVRRPEHALEERESGLSVAVVFTSVDATVAALKRAGTLAESLGAHITLVVPQVVPYALPLTSPPVLLEFQEKRFREIAAESPVDITVRLYLCRDDMEVLKKVLRPHSLVVVGGKKRFWPTPAKRLARRLQKAGHEVIFAETR